MALYHITLHEKKSMTFIDYNNKDFYIAAKKLLMDKGKKIELDKGDYLCHTGDRNNNVAMLTSGSMKYSRLTTRGHERIVSFAFTGDLVASYSAMRNDVPSPVDIVALESSTIYQMPISRVEATLGPRIMMRLGEAVARKAFLEAIDTCCLTAQERYIALTSRFPDIHNRMTNRTIASYLGITPESLSRMCKRLLTSQP